MILWLSGTVGATTLSIEQLAEHTHSSSEFVAPGAVYGNMLSQAANFTNKEGTYGTGGSQSHTHGFTGSSANSSNLPPYYTLTIIMRIA